MRTDNLPKTTVADLHFVGLSCMGVYALSLLADGISRWLFDAAGIAPLFYTRDALPVFAIMASFGVATGQGRYAWKRLMALIGGYFLVWCVWGLLQGLAPAQVLFGGKVLLTIPAGASLWVLLKGKETVLTSFCVVAGALGMAGVIVDYFYDLPWAGLVYEVGDLHIEAQREVFIYKIARLGGFSRASFDVAAQLAVFASLLFVSRHARLTRLCFLGFLLGGIILTTSRSFLIAFVGVLACGLFFYSTKASIFRFALLPLVWLPILIVLIEFGIKDFTGSIVNYDRGGLATTLSFAMRTEGNWLDSLGMLEGTTAWVMGLGLGGIGAAQKPFEPDAYVAPDNLLIYSLVNFGIIGSLILFAGLTAAWFILLSRKQLSPYALLLPLTGIVGMTMSAVETPFIGIGLGLAFAEAFSTQDLLPRRSSRFPVDR